MKQIAHLFFILASVAMLLPMNGHAQSIPADTLPSISPEAQKLKQGFIPFDKKRTPMTIVRGGQKTQFMPLPKEAESGPISLERNRFYRLPTRPDGPIFARPTPDGMNADPTSANIDAIRKQQALDAAGKLPTSLQPNSNAPTTTHGVRVTHGIEPSSTASPAALPAPQRRSSHTAPPTSAIPKGDTAIAPTMRATAAQRAAQAGSTADPLDILLKSAP